MPSTNHPEKREVVEKIQEVAKKAFEAQTEIETTSGVLGNELCVNEERNFEHIIKNYLDVTSTHLLKLKMRLNALVPINRFPTEILAHIVLLSGLPMNHVKHPYIPYTWVCRHWRSTLIQNPNVWSSVQLQFDDDDVEDPIFRELIQRSRSNHLDVMISKNVREAMPAFEILFAAESYRIRRLWLLGADEGAPCLGRFPPSISGKSFPSLRAVKYTWGYYSLLSLLPVLAASDLLDTFQCTLLEDEALPPDAVEQLAIIFSRLRHLNILTYNAEVIKCVVSSLHSATKLRYLQHELLDSELDPGAYDLTILPELQFLNTNDIKFLQYFRAPKLSTLATTCSMMTCPILDDFNYSSIRHLYLIGPIAGVDRYIIIGQNDAPRFPFSETFINYMKFINSIGDMFIEDSLCETCPLDCLYLRFFPEDRFSQVLSSILPRMTNLVGLYSLFDNVVEYEGTYFDRFVTRAPSVEKVVVQYSNQLLDFIRPLGDPSLYPRLKHLSYVTAYPRFLPPGGIGNLADDVGKLLTECLQSRQKAHGNTLEFVTLEKCPPIPDIWVAELRKLGTTVVTEKDVERCIQQSGDPHPPAKVLALVFEDGRIIHILAEGSKQELLTKYELEEPSVCFACIVRL